MFGSLVSIINKRLAKLGWKLIRIKPAKPLHASRFEYQHHYMNFDSGGFSKVLDIGSGGDPFPHATILAERYIQPSSHRYAEFRSEGKPVVVCDIQCLPFRDKSFEYVYCSHVLEHVDDPLQACQEIMRVGDRGYIETPHFMTDALFSWAEGMHKWFVQSIGNRLVFFEYDKRRLEGVRSSAWKDVIFGPTYHPLQDVFAENKDLFAVIFPWEKSFLVDVYYGDGTVRRINDQ